MPNFPEGNAIVYCEGAFGTANGKTAHGLVRRTRRYRVLSVVDSRGVGQDAGEVLDDRTAGIPVLGSVREAVEHALAGDNPATHLVVGLAPDGGRLSPPAREDILGAMRFGLSIDCGLHDYLGDDPAIAALAAAQGITVRDVRRPPRVSELHFFSGKITQVAALKVAVLGTDSAVGKRTTAWLLVDALLAHGYRAEMIGTGQTAWMQGVHYGVIMDALINDFVAGEIEHVVWSAWNQERPEVIVIEGQGSMMNPAYPGGFEILAAARPDVVVLQHAPARKEYDGFPGHALHSLAQQIQAIELISGKPVVAVTISHEGLAPEQVPAVCERLQQEVERPVTDVLLEGTDKLVEVLVRHLP